MPLLRTGLIPLGAGLEANALYCEGEIVSTDVISSRSVTVPIASFYSKGAKAIG